LVVDILDFYGFLLKERDNVVSLSRLYSIKLLFNSRLIEVSLEITIITVHITHHLVVPIAIARAIVLPHDGIPI
jgi:hypothetical protein